MESTTHPSVALIIVNWNGYELTKACLLSLREDSYPNKRIILVDNGSHDGSGQKLKEEFPEVEVLFSEKNLGFTGGNNLGIEKALADGFDYLMLLNNDTTVESGFLAPMVEFLEKNEGYVAAQPKILFAHNRKLLWNAGGGYFKPLEMSWSVGIGKEDLGQYDQEKDTPWITGCAFLIKCAAVQKYGPLESSFFAYYEDVEWSFRLQKGGQKMRYLPQAKIYHVAGGSSKSHKGKEGTVPPIIHYYRTRNHLLLIRKHANPISFILSLGYQTLKNTAFVVYLTLRFRFTKAKAIIKGHYEGLFAKF